MLEVSSVELTTLMCYVYSICAEMRQAKANQKKAKRLKKRRQGFKRSNGMTKKSNILQRSLRAVHASQTQPRGLRVDDAVIETVLHTNNTYFEVMEWDNKVHSDLLQPDQMEVRGRMLKRGGFSSAKAKRAKRAKKAGRGKKASICNPKA